METLRIFRESDIDRVLPLITETIRLSYADVYPPEGLNYFFIRHTAPIILEDAKKGYFIVIESNKKIVACGILSDNYIGRVYVDPRCQGKGYGKKIMLDLEREARCRNIKKLKLCASLPSKDFYLRLGYFIKEEVWLPIENQQTLHYFEMRKEL